MIRSASSFSIRLPTSEGGIEDYVVISRDGVGDPPGMKFRSRVAFAAAHVVVDPLATLDPISASVLDIPATLAYRRHLWSWGFGIAEAMDTAQRGNGLQWEQAKELIRVSCAEARACDGDIACGANTDQLSSSAWTLGAITEAYREQCAWIEECGGRVILMASRALARTARSSDDYLRVYADVLSGLSQPAILHWLGDAFDPSLSGYWGGASVHEAMEICLQLIHACREKVDGVKISLLDHQREVEMRRRLPPGVRMYTGDDFHYPELIEGDHAGYSDALLGIFDAIAPAAAKAFQALDDDDIAQYRSFMAPTLALSRVLFQKPTYYYKTGIVFLGYLNGFQKHFHMLGGQQSARSIGHFAEVFRLADQASILLNPEMAVARMRKVLALAGVE